MKFALNHQRYSAVRSMLPSERLPRVLVIGDDCETGRAQLSECTAEVVSFRVADGDVLPFADRYFDAVVSGSALGASANLDALCTEIDRVLEDEGCLIVDLPALRWFAQATAHAVFGKNSDSGADYGGRLFMTILQRRFHADARVAYPSVLSVALPVYRVLRLRKIGPGTTLNLWDEDNKTKSPDDAGDRAML